MAFTIEQIQSNITNKHDAREIINQIADYLQDNPGGGSPGSSYLVYVPLISQVLTGVPVPVDLGGNTITGTWVRYALWSYAFETDVDFVADKGWIAGASFGGAGILIPLTSNFSTVNGWMNVYWGSNNGKFYYEVDVYDENFDPAELSAYSGSSKIGLPEFRVYP